MEIQGGKAATLAASTLFCKLTRQYLASKGSRMTFERSDQITLAESSASAMFPSHDSTNWSNRVTMRSCNRSQAENEKPAAPAVFATLEDKASYFFFSSADTGGLKKACDVQHNRHLQSTKNSSEKECRIDDTDHAYISLTLSSMITPKECRRSIVTIRRYSDGCHNHFCAVLIVIILAASWHRH
jgi:hypothetical protein